MRMKTDSLTNFHPSTVGRINPHGKITHRDTLSKDKRKLFSFRNVAAEAHKQTCLGSKLYHIPFDICLFIAVLMHLPFNLHFVNLHVFRFLCTKTWESGGKMSEKYKMVTAHLLWDAHFVDSFVAHLLWRLHISKSEIIVWNKKHVTG